MHTKFNTPGARVWLAPEGLAEAWATLIDGGDRAPGLIIIEWALAPVLIPGSFDADALGPGPFA